MIQRTPKVEGRRRPKEKKERKNKSQRLAHDFPFICAYLEELIRLIIARDGVKARPVLRLAGDGDGHA